MLSSLHSDRCAQCSLLEPNKPFDGSFMRDKGIDVIQIEPSMACQLECPSCWSKKDRKIVLPKTDAGHLILDPAEGGLPGPVVIAERVPQVPVAAEPDDL